VEGKDEPVYRPYRDTIEMNGERYDKFTDLELFTLPSTDEGSAALGWFLHHGYKGAIPDKRVGGLRVRCGNIQVGGRDLLADTYKESRFGAWTTGEVHILDSRIIPNGRRDYFEQGVHLDNLLNHLTPYTRQITARCRESSRFRNHLREFSRNEVLVSEKIAALIQGSIDKKRRDDLVLQIEEALSGMLQSLSSDAFDDSMKISLNEKISSLRRKLKRTQNSRSSGNKLDQFPKSKREVYEKIFGLIYECSDNPESARKLINKIIAKLES